MANAYTDILSGASLGTNLVQTAYDRMVQFALRADPLMRDMVDYHPVQVDKPGSSVVIQFYADMAVATTALTETTDPDAVAVPATTTVSVTPNEYGNATLNTRKLLLESLSDVEPAIANIVAYNMRDTLDALVLNVARVGTNVITNRGGTINANAGGTSLAATDFITSATIRYAVAKLRAGKAQPKDNGYFWCGIHPEVSVDLRQDTGASGWRDPLAA